MSLLKIHGKRPERLRDPATVEALPPPSWRPNCASSHPDARPARKVEPLHFDGSPVAAIAALRDIVAALPGATVQHVREGRYLYATFKSKTWEFVDDLELLAAADGQRTRIDVRSASRVGISDRGVNRRRVERVRAALMARVAG